MGACMNGHLGVVQALLATGTDKEAKDKVRAGAIDR